MKLKELVVGNVYHDGKVGVRALLGIDGDTVRYRLLSAMQKQSWTAGQEQGMTVIGSELTMTTQAFAAWAKHGMSAEEGVVLMTSLAARKVKLSPGEVAFVEAVIDELDGDSIQEWGRVSYDHTEGRAVAGLQKKGIVVCDKKTHEAEFTALGVAKLEQIRQAASVGA